MALAVAKTVDRHPGPVPAARSTAMVVESRLWRWLASTAGSSVDAQLAALQEQLAQIDVKELGNGEKQQLLTTLSKLLKG